MGTTGDDWNDCGKPVTLDEAPARRAMWSPAPDAERKRLASALVRFLCDCPCDEGPHPVMCDVCIAAGDLARALADGEIARRPRG